MSEIAVIVPIYRVEAYLKRCVDSILGQSFRDLTLVLVDDGSPDGCPGMCDEFARQDPRIHVIHQANGGLSAARNAGIDWVLEHTRCGWLTFVDSDDWVDPDFLKVLLEAALSRNTAVSICGFVSTSGENPVILPEQLAVETVEPRDFYIRDRVTATVACAKLYRRECFGSIRYPEGRVHEDEYVTYRILLEQEKLAYVPAPLYRYFCNEAGITKGIWSPRRMDAFGAFEQQIRYFRERGDQQLADICLHYYMRNAYGQMMELRRSENHQAYRQEEREIRTRARALLGECHRKGCVSFERDYCVLTEFYPVRTRLHLYYLAAMRRLKKK